MFTRSKIYFYPIVLEVHIQAYHAWEFEDGMEVEIRIEVGIKDGIDNGWSRNQCHKEVKASFEKKVETRVQNHD